MLKNGKILPILRPSTCGPRCLAADAVRGAGCPELNSRRSSQTSSIRERYRFLRTLKWRGFLEPTPVQQRVFDSLTSRGVKILELYSSRFHQRGRPPRPGRSHPRNSRCCRMGAQHAGKCLGRDRLGVPDRRHRSRPRPMPQPDRACVCRSISIPAAACGPTWIRGNSLTSLSDSPSANIRSSMRHSSSSELTLR